MSDAKYSAPVLGNEGRRLALYSYLAQHLVETQPDLTVFACVRRSNADLGEFDRVASRVLVADIGMIGGAIRSPYRLVREYLRQARHIRNLKPAFVISTMNSPFASLLVLMLRASGLRILYVAHDAEPHPGDYAVRWQRLSQEIMIRCSERVVTLSRFVENRLRMQRSFGSGALATVPLGTIVPARYTAHPAMPPSGPVRFLFVGRLLAYKGLPLLYQALTGLRERQDWCLTIAGDGPLASWVEDAFRGWPQVTLELRWLSEQRFTSLLDTHHLLLCPYSEASQSGVAARAIASGLPIAATPEGGLTEQVRPVDDRLVADDSTPEAFAALLAEVLDAPHDLGRLSERCFHVAREHRADRGWRNVLDLPGADLAPS